MASLGSAGPVLVTGASGFVGRALVERLVTKGVPTLAAVRRATTLAAGAQQVQAPDLGPDADWRSLWTAPTVWCIWRPACT